MEKKRIVFKVNKGLSDMFDREALRQHRSRSNLLEVLMIKLLTEELLIKEFELDLEKDFTKELKDLEDDEDDVL